MAPVSRCEIHQEKSARATLQTTVAIGCLQLPKWKKPRKVFCFLLWQLDRVEAAAAPSPQVLSVARLSVCSQYVHAQTPIWQTHMHVAGCTDQHRHTPSTHTNSTNVLILLLSLAAQGEGLTVGYACHPAGSCVCSTQAADAYSCPVRWTMGKGGTDNMW